MVTTHRGVIWLQISYEGYEGLKAVFPGVYQCFVPFVNNKFGHSVNTVVGFLIRSIKHSTLHRPNKSFLTASAVENHSPSSICISCSGINRDVNCKNVEEEASRSQLTQLKTKKSDWTILNGQKVHPVTSQVISKREGGPCFSCFFVGSFPDGYAK